MKPITVPLGLLTLFAAWGIGRWTGPEKALPDVRISAPAVDVQTPSAPTRAEGASWSAGAGRAQPPLGLRGGDPSEPPPALDIPTDEVEGAEEESATGEPNILQLVHTRVGAEVAVLRDAAQLTNYLGVLEERALRLGRVSALEVEPGLEAIRRFENELGSDATHARMAEFSARMAALGRRFSGADTRPHEQEASSAGLARTLGEIASAPTDRRDQLERSFRERVGALPADERMRALDQLARLPRP